MIMKGRSPTMRHVSRTHRVALDWLFDRINLDSKIQIKYIDTKNQLADILTKGIDLLDNARTRELSAWFTTEYGNPGIRKSMLPHSALFARDLFRHSSQRVAPFYHEVFRLQR